MQPDLMFSTLHHAFQLDIGYFIMWIINSPYLVFASVCIGVLLLRRTPIRGFFLVWVILIIFPGLITLAGFKFFISHNIFVFFACFLVPFNLIAVRVIPQKKRLLVVMLSITALSYVFS